MFAGVAASGRYHGNGAYGDGYGARYRGNTRRFSAYGILALWDASMGVTLNGTDVSALASQVGGAIDLAQATGARQPLYTGAPTYNGQPSIRFTAANGDNLFRNATSIWTGGAGSFFITTAVPLGINGTFLICDTDGATNGFDLKTVGASSPWARQFDSIPGHAHLTGSIIDDGEVYTMLGTLSSSPASAHLYLNGTDVAISNPTDGTFNDTNASSVMLLGAVTSAGVGAANMDFLEAAVFDFVIPPSVVDRMAKASAARFGFFPAP